jgi:carboxymethylenebutenolidase
VPARASRRAILRTVVLGLAGVAVAGEVGGCTAASPTGGGSSPAAGRPTAATASATPPADDVLAVGPAGGAPVLLLHSWWGRKPAVLEWADSLAAAGRRVLIPDLFGGRTADTVPEAEALLASVGQQAGRAVAERCADALAAQGRPWAAVGFSLGALYACQLAGRGAAGPDELHLFYGGGDPQGDVSRTRRARLHVVADDAYFTADEIAATENALRAAGVDVRTSRYAGSRHWFAERDTPGFDPAAFALARSRVLDGLGG